MKLYDLPKESKLRIETQGGHMNATFHHIDGMYSFCTLDDKPEGENIFHLKAWTPMIEVDGRWQIDYETDSAETKK